MWWRWFLDYTNVRFKLIVLTRVFNRGRGIPFIYSFSCLDRRIIKENKRPVILSIPFTGVRKYYVTVRSSCIHVQSFPSPLWFSYVLCLTATNVTVEQWHRLFCPFPSSLERNPWCCHPPLHSLLHSWSIKCHTKETSLFPFTTKSLKHIFRVILSRSQHRGRRMETWQEFCAFFRTCYM